MIRRGALHRLAQLLCLAGVVLGGVSTRAGFVVCVGVDGHFEVGAGSDDCGDCERPGAPDAPLSISSALGNPDCCPCVDVEVLPSADQHFQVLPGGHYDLSGCYLGILPPSHDRLPAPFALRPTTSHGPPVRPPDAIGELRTVILII